MRKSDTTPTPDTEPLTIKVNAIFGKLAAHYQLAAERIAEALVYSFCLNPPRNLTLVQRTAKGGGR